MKRLALLVLIAISPIEPRAQIFNPSQGSLVSRFDKNGDGWLNAEERAPARATLRGGNRSIFSLLGGLVRGGSGQPIAPADVKSYPDKPFYDETVMRTVFLTFENSDWESELDDFHGTDVDVPATMMIDGKTYRDVGVRFRGSSSYSFLSPGQKRSFNVSVDMAHSDQDVRGYKTLNLLNGHEDATFMRSILYLHIAREYIPAPKANYARVVINGINWGLFINVQQFNKEFIKENYQDTGGARWKAPGSLNGRAGLQYFGDSGAIYKSLFEIKSKDDPAQWDALAQLAKTLNQTPLPQLESALSPILDIDGVLRFLALDVALVNNDGYWTRASDFSLYRDSKGKFHIIPHDTNETFSMPLFRGATGYEGDVTLDVLTKLNDPSKPLRSRLLAVPALREKYLGYVRDIATKWLDWKTSGPLVEQYRKLIDAEVKADPRKLHSYEEFVDGTAGPTRSLMTFMNTRRKLLLTP